MPRLRLGIIIAFTLLLSPSVRASAGFPEDALSIYDRTAETVTEKFYDQTFRGLPWRDLVLAYREELVAGSSDRDLEETLNDLLANLHASHTEFLSDADQEYHGLESIFSGRIEGDAIYQIGAWFQKVGDRWFVRDAFPGSVAEAAGLKSGDEIVSVDGKLLEPVQAFLSGRSVDIRFRESPAGPVYQVKVRPARESVQQILLRATRISTRLLQSGTNRIGYFHLWSGTHGLFLQALKDAVTRFADTTDGLILDLRDGFGGADDEYLQPFVNEAGHYTRPLVVLVNDGVRSGKEGVAYQLKKSGRARLVGTTTAGHYLGGELFEIVPGRFALYLAVISDPSAPPIEGVGVSPDVLVPAPLPYSRGNDPQLERALQLLIGRTH